MSEAAALPEAFASYGLPALPPREKIAALIVGMLARPADEHVEMCTLHAYCPGVYARTVLMLAGETVVSNIHNTQHFFIVRRGRCVVVDTLGNEQEFNAGDLGITMPGTQRALHILEDCIWTTFHVTNLTDPEAIGREILAESFEAFDAGAGA